MARAGFVLLLGSGRFRNFFAKRAPSSVFFCSLVIGALLFTRTRREKVR